MTTETGGSARRSFCGRDTITGGGSGSNSTVHSAPPPSTYWTMTRSVWYPARVVVLRRVLDDLEHSLLKVVLFRFVDGLKRFHVLLSFKIRRSYRRQLAPPPAVPRGQVAELFD